MSFAARRVVRLLGLLIAVASCGGDKGGGLTGPPSGSGSPSEVAAVEVSTPSDTLFALGDSVALSVVVKDEEGRAVSGVSVTWSSSDTSVVVVGSKGVARAVGNGVARVAAKVSGVIGEAELVVRQRVAEVRVDPASVSLSAVGASQRLTAEALDANGHGVDGVRVDWSSSDTSVAVVDTAGVVVARGPGEAAISASAEGVRGGAKAVVRLAAAALRYRVQPSDRRAGESFAPAVQVEILDAEGRRVEDATDEVTISITPSYADIALQGTRTVRAQAGVATFSDLSVVAADTAGFTLVATLAGLAPVESDRFRVAPGDPDRLEFAIEPSDREAGASNSVRVSIRDRWGNHVWGATNRVRLSLGANPTDAVLNGTVESTAVNGMAGLDFSIEKAGVGYTVVASAEGLESVESAPCEIGPAKAAAVKFMEMPARVEGREPFLVRVGLYDRFDNLAASSADSIRLELVSSPRGDTLGGTLVRPVVDGVTTFDDLILMLPGDDYRLDAIRQREAGQVRSDPFAVGLTFASVAVGGSSHVCGVTQPGHLYCWGVNVGDGTSEFRSSPVPVSIPSSTRFAMVEAGVHHTCAVTVEGAAYCWGAGYGGALGDGSGTPKQEPTRVGGGITFRSVTAGETHSCGLDVHGKAYCWGRAADGMLGNGATTGNVLVPVPVAGNLGFAELSAGSLHTCGITTDGAAYCWGRNNYGQLGNPKAGTGSATPVRLPTPGPIGSVYVAISAGDLHTCAVIRPPPWRTHALLLGPQQLRPTR